MGLELRKKKKKRKEKQIVSILKELSRESKYTFLEGTALDHNQFTCNTASITQ